jgi:hypothetical protein
VVCPIFCTGYIFYSLNELCVLAERWSVHYNNVRPHSSLGYKSPASAAWLTETSQGHIHYPQAQISNSFWLSFAGRVTRRYTNNLAGTKDRADHRLPKAKCRLVQRLAL